MNLSFIFIKLQASLIQVALITTNNIFMTHRFHYGDLHLNLSDGLQIRHFHHSDGILGIAIAAFDSSVDLTRGPFTELIDELEF